MTASARASKPLPSSTDIHVGRHLLRPFGSRTPLHSLRKQHPIVYQLTNFVSAQLQADLTALFGGCPVMTRHPGEALDVVKQSDAILINVGTPDEETPSLCNELLHTANKRGTPAVLDINGYGFTSFRTEFVGRLLRDFSFAVVRGNAGEIAALAGGNPEKIKIEGMAGSAPVEIARRSTTALSEKFRTVVAATGPTSYVAAEGKAIEIAGGDGRLARLSGWGCALGSLIALFCAVEEPFEAARTALEIFRDASSRASEGAVGIGTFRRNFWDELSRIAEDEA